MACPAGFSGFDRVDPAGADRAQVRPVVAQVEHVGELLTQIQPGQPDAPEVPRDRSLRSRNCLAGWRRRFGSTDPLFAVAAILSYRLVTAHGLAGSLAVRLLDRVEVRQRGGPPSDS